MPVYKPEGERNYRIQFRIAGKTYVKSAKTADKRIAERMEAEWRTEIHGGLYLRNREPITVSQMFDNYLALPIAETTKKGARTFFKLFRKFTHCNVKAHEFNQGELEKYVAARRLLGKKESGIRTHLLIFMGAWNVTGNSAAFFLDRA